MPIHKHQCENMRGRMEYDWRYQTWFYHSEEGRWATDKPNSVCPICLQKMPTLPRMTLCNVFNADLKPFMEPKKACQYAAEAGFCYVAFAGWVHLINSTHDGYEAAFCIRYSEVPPTDPGPPPWRKPK